MAIIKKTSFIFGIVLIIIGIALGIYFKSIISDYPKASSMYEMLMEVRTPLIGMVFLLAIWFIWQSFNRNKKHDWFVILGFFIIFIIFSTLFVLAII